MFIKVVIKVEVTKVRSSKMSSWQDDFPMTDTYTAANGRKIEFSITAEELPMGYIVTAEETSKSRGNRSGYR